MNSCIGFMFMFMLFVVSLECTRLWCLLALCRYCMSDTRLDNSAALNSFKFEFPSPTVCQRFQLLHDVVSPQHSRLGKVAQRS
ncbi:hypothetical protein BO99DRAFT_116957 [Aspergillus violaceofuscus CBS 115571]|uniref:Secreted protein n=1 Tax=Aspergillus violaceofuscus (strain CBS 115571) TaxID=1450538 RepID=A0A2V5HCB8_ASPV1|nr:hypothetical protein BO99DRAFT_116957 [Aspergillus violaceofuscus CBS 115571]